MQTRWTQKAVDIRVGDCYGSCRGSADHHGGWGRHWRCLPVHQFRSGGVFCRAYVTVSSSDAKRSPGHLFRQNSPSCAGPPAAWPVMAPRSASAAARWPPLTANVLHAKSNARCCVAAITRCVSWPVAPCPCRPPNNARRPEMCCARELPITQPSRTFAVTTRYGMEPLKRSHGRTLR